MKSLIRKIRSIGIAGLFLLCAFAASPTRAAVIDSYVGIRGPGSTTAAVVDAGGNLQIALASGTLTTSPAYISAFDAVNYSVPASSNSGVNLNAPATASAFVLSNEATATIRVCIGCTASSTVGLFIPAGGSLGLDGVSINSISVYNISSTAPAAISIIYGRMP